MKEQVERLLSTKGKEENITSMVIFPYNEDDLKEQFQVEDTKELYFAEKPGGKLSIRQFNSIMCEALERGTKIERQLEAVVKFLAKKMKTNTGKWKKISDTVPLNFEDSMVWNYCMKEDYKHKDDKVKVWLYNNELTVLYGDEEEV